MRKRHAIVKIIVLAVLFEFLFLDEAMAQKVNGNKARATAKAGIRAVNEDNLQRGDKTIAIVGATLIDGNGGQPLADACVIVQGNRITGVGKKNLVKVPNDAEIVDAKGLFLLPGLIDAHFHLDGVKGLPNQFLRNGVTSLRDPGEWIEMYNEERAADHQLPRLFLTGPHLDMAPPAYPMDAYVVRDAAEAIKGVNTIANMGATAIKIYYRVSLGIIGSICNAAHKRGLPVTTHLELSDARDVVLAGVDGIEHVTSLGTSLLPAMEAERYKQAVLADNNARKKGRYEVWNSLNIHSQKVDSLISFLKKHQTFLSPTLAIFEYRLGQGKTDTVQWNGFKNMMAFMGRAKKGGVRVVVGSHGVVPYASQGWAYQREMELMAESGMTATDIIVAATMENARFFRVEDRLGSIEKGKLADLILVKENPLADIKAMRNIHKVMLNGKWVTSD